MEEYIASEEQTKRDKTMKETAEAVMKFATDGDKVRKNDRRLTRPKKRRNRTKSIWKAVEELVSEEDKEDEDEDKEGDFKKTKKRIKR